MKILICLGKNCEQSGYDRIYTLDDIKKIGFSKLMKSIGNDEVDVCGPDPHDKRLKFRC